MLNRAVVRDLLAAGRRLHHVVPVLLRQLQGKDRREDLQVARAGNRAGNYAGILDQEFASEGDPAVRPPERFLLRGSSAKQRHRFSGAG